MATILFVALSLLGCICVGAHESGSNSRGVSAIYVFGDSSVDAGNNNYLDAKAKACDPPYGVDFDGPIKGRFTNGKTYVDFIAEFLGLPLPPPFESLKNEAERKKASMTGVNYGSGDCGAFKYPENPSGNCLSLEEQLMRFVNQTVKEDLLKQLKDERELSKHLANSIAVISYTNGYDYDYKQIIIKAEFEGLGRPNVRPSKLRMNATEIVLFGISETTVQLHNVGVRKFLIAGVDDLGCQWYSKKYNKGKCDEFLTLIAQKHNKGLPRMVDNLNYEYAIDISTVTMLDLFPFTKDLKSNPAKYGLPQNTKTEEPCCKLGDDFRCAKDSIPCSNRGEYLFFDGMNPTEVTHKLMAKHCIDGSICTPLSLKKLAEAKVTPGPPAKLSDDDL